MWYQQQPQQHQPQGAQQPMIVVVMPQDQQSAAQYQQQDGQPVQTQPVYQQYTQPTQPHQQQYGQAYTTHSLPAHAEWQQQPAQQQHLQQQLPSGQAPAQIAPAQQWQPQQQYLQQQQPWLVHPTQAVSQQWQQQDPVEPHQEPIAHSWQQQQQQPQLQLDIPPWQQPQQQRTVPQQPPARGSSFAPRWQQQRQQRQGGQQGVRQQWGQQQQQGREQGGRQGRPQQGQQQQQEEQRQKQQQQQRQAVQGTGQLGRRPQQDNKPQGQQQAKRQRTSGPPAQMLGQPGAVHLQQGQQQRQGPGVGGAAAGFDYQQWQQDSQRWEAQLQQKRGGAAQGRHSKQQQQQQQQPGQKTQQLQQQKQKSKQKAQEQEQQQQQPESNAPKLSKKARKTLRKRQQQEQEQQGLQQQHQQQDANQVQFPLLRLPPRVIAAIASYLTDDEKFKLAKLLPESSAAAAVVRGGVRQLLLQPRKPPMHVDVPKSIGMLRSLQQLSMCLWMNGKIQARTGLSSLSSLSHLSALQLTADVALDLANSRKLGGKGKKGEAGQAYTEQQVQDALQEASVKVQEDLWQITAALGSLTNLKRLELNLSQYSIDNSREILKHVGYQAFAQLSSLTGLESLTLTYSVCQAGSGLNSLSGLSSLTHFSLEETGSGGSVIAGKQRFYLQANQEAGVAALGEFWRNATNLRSVRIRTPYLGPEAVGKFAVQPSLQVLNVSGCRLLFPRFRTTFEQLTALQELHVSGCEGLTAADLATAAPGLASSLTYLDISRNSRQGDGAVMRGSIAAIGQLTSLHHLNAYGTGIAAAAGAGNGSAGGISSSGACAVLSNLQQLTFLSVGSVFRSVMMITPEDAVHLSALTNLSVLHLHGAALGVGLREPGTPVDAAQSHGTQRAAAAAEGDLKAALMARLEFLRPLSALSGLRLWACRFSHINRDRVQGIARLLLDKKQLVMKKHDVLDIKWYPGEEERAEYSGDEDDEGAAAVAGKSSVFKGVQLD